MKRTYLLVSEIKQCKQFVSKISILVGLSRIETLLSAKSHLDIYIIGVPPYNIIKLKKLTYEARIAAQ